MLRLWLCSKGVTVVSQEPEYRWRIGDSNPAIPGEPFVVDVDGAEVDMIRKAIQQHSWQGGVQFHPGNQPAEAVNHPAHYGGDTTYEAIKVIEAWGLGFHDGNAVKYICRQGKKSGFGAGCTVERVEDLKKARWYLDRLISRLEGGQGSEDLPGSTAGGADRE